MIYKTILIILEILFVPISLIDKKKRITPKLIKLLAPVLLKCRITYSIIMYPTLKRIYNLYLTRIEEFLRIEKVKGRPIYGYIDPSDYCNLKCPPCYSGGRSHRRVNRKMMNYQDYKHILDKIDKNNLFFIFLYIWGEPLLNPEVFKMIHYTKEKNIGTIISTNFQVFNDGMADDMVKSGLDRIIISIDGASQESYGKYRIGGSWDKVIKNTKTLVRKKRELKSESPLIEFQFIVMKHNENETGKMKKLVRKLNVDVLSFIKFCEMSVKKEEIEHFLPTNKKYIDDLWTNPVLKRCEVLWREVAVNSKGQILACCACFPTADDSFPFGDIKKGEFDDIWNNKYFVNSRRLFKRFSKNKQKHALNPPCSRCTGISCRNPSSRQKN